MPLQAFKHKTFKIAHLNFSALNVPTANVMVHSRKELDFILINNLKEDFSSHDKAHFKEESLMKTIIIPGVIGVQQPAVKVAPQSKVVYPLTLKSRSHSKVGYEKWKTYKYLYFSWEKMGFKGEEVCPRSHMEFEPTSPASNSSFLQIKPNCFSRHKLSKCKSAQAATNQKIQYEQSGIFMSCFKMQCFHMNLIMQT